MLNYYRLVISILLVLITYIPLTNTHSVSFENYIDYYELLRLLYFKWIFYFFRSINEWRLRGNFDLSGFKRFDQDQFIALLDFFTTLLSLKQEEFGEDLMIG